MTNPIQSVAVIGSGISGLACARKLRGYGVEARVFEKSRGVGGRVATRRSESGATFDHGAQYFTARDPDFIQQTKQWCNAGTAALWPGRIVTLHDGDIIDAAESHQRYVGVPGMSAIAKLLAAGIDVQTNVTIQSFRRTDGRWHIADSAGSSSDSFDFVICAIPPQQATKLIRDQSPTLTSSMSAVRMAPCWAVLLQIGEPMSLPFDAAFVRDSPLNWMARNSSKPQREGGECWVLHATAAWSAEHLEELPEAVVKTLIEAFWRSTQRAALPIECAVAHRWRYAIPLEPLSQRCLLDPQTHLGACGDWCGGPRVEGAYLSGLAMAERLMREIR
jgi:renalase